VDFRFLLRHGWVVAVALLGVMAVIRRQAGADGWEPGRGEENRGMAGEATAGGGEVIFEGVGLHPGRRRDEIQTMDHPVFASEAPNTAALSDSDLVVGVSRGGESRAYPLWVLARREIINDRIGAEPVCVTYCPLSASVVVFLARMGGEDLVFGNEGALYECNLVLYDRGSGSLWYQLRGMAIHGSRAGEHLSKIPAELVSWGNWRRRHPEGRVLVGDERTGRMFRMADGASTEGLAAPGSPEAPVSRMDPRLPTMERVLGVEVEGQAVCWPVSDLEQLPDGRHAIPGSFLFKNGLLTTHEPGIPVGKTSPPTAGETPTATEARFMEASELWLEKHQDHGVRVVTGDGTEIPLIPAYWFAWQAAFPAGRVGSVSWSR
jgi:hypothetical protein